jgi:hypothetical protein
MWFALKPRPEGKWQPLKNGGSIRALPALAGATQEVSVAYDSYSPLEERLLKVIHGPNGGRIPTTFVGNPNGISVWIEWRDRPSSTFAEQIKQISDLEIALPDGQILFTSPDGSGVLPSAVNVGVWRLAHFPLIPWHERKLTVTFTLDDERHELRILNPAYKPNVPIWTPQPLSQSWRDGDLTVTLEALDLKWNDQVFYKGMRWELEPKWTITWKGNPANSWFDVSFVVEDSGGNRSHFGGLLGEPAWKLTCTVSRSSEFPFASDEVRWLKRFDPAELSKDGDGNHQLCAMDADLRTLGLTFAGAFMPGTYEILDGSVITGSAPTPSNPVQYFKPVLNRKTGQLHLEVPKASFIHHPGMRFSRKDNEFLVFQYEDGSRVHLNRRFGSGQGDEMVSTAALPEKPFRCGIAKNHLFTFETFVKPPKAPVRTGKGL